MRQYVDEVLVGRLDHDLAFGLLLRIEQPEPGLPLVALQLRLEAAQDGRGGRG